MSYFQKIRKLTSQRSAFGLTLHIGKRGDRFPSSVDYFIADGAFKERFNLIYAGANGVVAPNSLDILFLPPDIRRVCRLFKEFRDGAGVVRGRVFVDWFTEEQPEKFVIYTPEVPDGLETTESEFTKYTSHWKATAGVDTLQLMFHLRKFLEQGILTLCQIQTRGDDSSIPGILTQLEQMTGLNKLDVPFILSAAMANSKGMKATNGEAETHKFPVLSLFPDFSQLAIESRNNAVMRFMELQALPIFTPQPKVLADAAPKNALNAAPEQPEAIDAEHIEVTDTTAIDAEIAELVDRGSTLIQQSANPQIETWWTSVLQQRDVAKLRAAVAGLEKKAAEKAALKPEHLDQPQPADVITSPQQEG